jgi:hypothetical protein
MIYEFMGAEKFDKFIDTNLQVGKRKMGARHRAILSNAKALGFTFGVGLATFLLISGQASAIASGLSCPAPVPLGFEFKQKFLLIYQSQHLLSKLILIMLAMVAFK